MHLEMGQLDIPLLLCSFQLTHCSEEKEGICEAFVLILSRLKYVPALVIVPLGSVKDQVVARGPP
jgi:hypothetical protein